MFIFLFRDISTLPIDPLIYLPDKNTSNILYLLPVKPTFKSWYIQKYPLSQSHMLYPLVAIILRAKQYIESMAQRHCMTAHGHTVGMEYGLDFLPLAQKKVEISFLSVSNVISFPNIC